MKGKGNNAKSLEEIESGKWDEAFYGAMNFHPKELPERQKLPLWDYFNQRILR